MNKIRQQLIKHKDNKLFYYLLIAYFAVSFSIKYFGKSFKMQRRRILAVATTFCLLLFCVSKPVLVFAESVVMMDECDDSLGEIEYISEIPEESMEEIDESSEGDLEEEGYSEEGNEEGSESEGDGESWADVEPIEDNPDENLKYQLVEELAYRYENMQEFEDKLAGSRDCRITIFADSSDIELIEGFEESEISTIYYNFDGGNSIEGGRDVVVIVPENYYGALTYWGADAYGNETEHKSVNIVTDTETPHIDISGNDVSENDGVECVTYSVTVREDKVFDTGISKFFTYVDGEQTHLDNLVFGKTVTTLGENSGFDLLSFDFTVTSECVKEILVKAFDVLGNENAISFTAGKNNTEDDSTVDPEPEEPANEEDPNPEKEVVVNYLLGEKLCVDAANASVLENVFVGANPIEITVGTVEEDNRVELQEDNPFVIEYTDIEGIFCDADGEVTYHDGKTFNYTIDSSYFGNIAFWGVDSYGNETEHQVVDVWLDMDKPAISVEREECVDGSMILHGNVKEGGDNGYGLLYHSDYANDNELEANNYSITNYDGNFVSPDGIMEYSYDLILDQDGINHISITAADWWNNKAVYEEDIDLNIVPMDVDMPLTMGVHVILTDDGGMVNVDPVRFTNNTPYDVAFTLINEEIDIKRLAGQGKEDKDCEMEMYIDYADERLYRGKISSGLNEDGTVFILPGTKNAPNSKDRELTLYMEGILTDLLKKGWKASDLTIKLKFDCKPAE